MVDLYDYQKEGANWLKRKRFAYLADEMGLGKTAQAIAAADLLNARPILVLCPAVARLNWQAEFEKFSTRRLNCYSILSKAGVKTLIAQPADVTICSYDLASMKDVQSVLSRGRWGACILDEAHYLKSRTAKRTRTALGVIAPRAERVWFLSGTPAPNNPSELWPALRLMGATELDFWSFARRYCVVRETPFGTQISGGRNLDELRRAMAPHILRRRKTDVLKELPPIRFDEVLIESTPIQREVFDCYFDNYYSYPSERRWPAFLEDIARQSQQLEALRASGLLGDGGNLAPDTAASALALLEPKVRSLRRYVGLQKVPKALELIRGELEAGAYDKIVVFAVHKDVLCELENGLRDYGAVKIYGGTAPRRRAKYISRFQEDPTCRVFLGQVVAAGTAITLTAAHQVLFVEADWTPANNQQAAMRVHRVGQTKPVTVRFAAMANSIDQRITRVLKQKTRVLVELFDEANQLPEISA